MKVLFIGGSSLVLNDLVKKYIKEGHDVHIIDKKINSYSDINSDKITFNKVSPRDTECEEIFKSNVFETVFFIPNSKEENENELPTLINILNCSTKGVVEKFIYFSTEEVYGDTLNNLSSENMQCVPSSDLGFNKLKCEEYLIHHTKKNNLKALILRLGKIYGPEVGVGYKGLSKEMFDWIYITDAIEAIHKLDYVDEEGIFNISNRASMEKITNTINWVPIISIEEGIRLAVKGEKYKNNDDSGKKKPKSKLMIKLLRAIYATLLFIGFLIADRWLGTDYTINMIPTMYIYVIIVSVFYGINGALFSTALVAIHQAIKYNVLDNKDLITLLLDYRFTVEMLLILVMGLFVGYAIEKRNLMNENLQNDMNLFGQKYKFLKDVSNKTFTEKIKLERKILNSNDSVGKIYGIVKGLNTLEPDDLLNKSVEVLEKILDNNTISIYTIDKSQNYLRLQFKSSNDKWTPRKSLKIEDEYYLKRLISKGEIFINKTLDSTCPDMAGTISMGDKFLGIVMVDKVNFEDLSLEYENLFRATLSLISSSVEKGMIYQNAIKDERFIEGTTILKNKYFDEMLKVKVDSQINNKSTMEVIKVQNSLLSTKSISDILVTKLRDTDIIGMSKNDEILILLNNSNEQDKSIVVERLGKAGLRTCNVDMEGIYDTSIGS